MCQREPHSHESGWFPEATDRCCRTCRHFHYIPPDERRIWEGPFSGRCRQGPPQFTGRLLTTSGYTVPQWENPEVIDWKTCGQWAENPLPPERPEVPGLS